MTDSGLVTPEEWETWRSFRQIRRDLERVLERDLQSSSEISNADFGILMALFGSGAKQLRPSELGDFLGWEKSRVSHQVSRMQTRGLIERRECDTDARGTVVAITPAGSRAVLGAMRGHNALLRRHFFDALTPEEAAVITTLAARVRETTGESSQ
jgi:DNA-binding MarR family transcriptional regulator